MDPALTALQGLNLGPPGNQQNINQIDDQNRLLSLLQSAQGQQQQQRPLDQEGPPSSPSVGPLFGGAPPPPPNGGSLPSTQRHPIPQQQQQQQQRPPPGFSMMPSPGQVPTHMQQRQQYDPLAGLPGFTSEPTRGGPDGPHGPPPSPQHQQQNRMLPPGLSEQLPPQQPPPGFMSYGSPRQGGPSQGLTTQPQGGARRMPGLPQQQQQAQPQAQQLLDLLKKAGGSGNPNIAHNVEQQQFIQQSGSAVDAQPPRQQQQQQQQQQQPSMDQLLQIMSNQRAQQQQRDMPSPRPLHPRTLDGESQSTTTLRVPAFRDHHQRGRQGSGGGDRKTNNTSHRASPAPGREGRWVDVMDRSHDGRSPRCDMTQLNTSLLSLAENLMPTAQERGTWQSAFESVKKVLLARWPQGSVILFGSAANGLSVRSSNDIDVSLQITAIGDDATGKTLVVEDAGKLLEDAGMTEILCLPKARVPVVKFTVPSTGTKVDITVNNTLACINTKLLADYCKVDPRLAQLVAVVKHWAKKRAVNDPYRGTLSSYCYVLMCIYHLQSRSPPVLPVLQALPPTVSVQVREWKAEFFDDVEALKGFGNENKQTLGELVWQFFEYWAWRHDYMSGVISIRTGSVLPKDEKDWTRRIGNERHLLCVEDPFELSHDLGRTVDRQTRDVMRKEFLRAATLLRDAEDPLEMFEGFKKR